MKRTKEIVKPDALRIIVPDKAMMIPELAKFMGMSSRTLWREVHRGCLKVVRFGRRCTRVYPTAVVEWIKRYAPDAIVEIECRAS